MKIFNWVHRRFNHGHGLSENVMKKEESDDIIGGVYGGWKGGILAIGTFGYNPLITCNDDDDDDDDQITTYNNMHGDNYNEKQELAMQETDGDYNDDDEDEEADDEEEEEEENPLIYSVYGRHDDFEGLMKGGGDEVRVLCGGDHCGKIKFDEYERSENVKRERERTTLAELFSADNSDGERIAGKKGVKKGDDNDGGDTMKRKSGGYKNAKKVIGGDNGRPTIHKLNRLMRRMLKRKIHPDVDCSNFFPN